MTVNRAQRLSQIPVAGAIASWPAGSGTGLQQSMLQVLLSLFAHMRTTHEAYATSRQGTLEPRACDASNEEPSEVSAGSGTRP